MTQSRYIEWFLLQYLLLIFFVYSSTIVSEGLIIVISLSGPAPVKYRISFSELYANPYCAEGRFKKPKTNLKEVPI